MAQTKDLFQAVQDGDLSIFQGLPATEIIDSHKDEDGNTLLSIAAKNGRKEAVQLLLEKYNANIYAENSFQATPLKYAAEYGYKDVVEILLQYANKIDSGAYGRAVSAAASKGHEDIIKLMLENNEIDERARSKYGSRAIVAATKSGKTAIVKHLLERDDINLDPVACHRALIEGAINGNDDPVRLLLESRDINIKVNEADGKGRVPLIEAARNGQTKIIELLFMMENINVNVLSNHKTALQVAMKKNHGKVVELLFTRKDLNLEAACVSLAEVIDWARENRYNDLEDFILATKTELPGRTPLSYFAEKGEVEVLKILLPEFDEDLRSKSNIQDHDGRTPLSRAAEKGRRAAVFFLTQRDADVNLADRDGRTPLWVAVENGHEEVVEDLVSVDTGTLLLLTQEGKQAATIKLMQHEGLKFDQKDAQGRTALHLAAMLGHYDIARHLLLLEAEGIINSKDHTGETPLLLAIGGKHKSIVQELLNHKADTKDIEAKEWRQAYDKPEYDTLMLSQKKEGGQSLDFPATFLSREELSKTSTTFTSRLYMLTDDLTNPIWSKEPVSAFEQAIIPNKLQIKSYNLGNDAWDICISLQLALPSCADSQLRFVDNKISRVMWRVIQPKPPGGPWTPIVYFSTLPYGWIPDDDLHLFRQFIEHLETPWLSFCKAFEAHLSARRVEQLEHMGDKLEMINFLAKDAQKLANLRSILATQTSDAEEFLKDYCVRFHREQASQDITMRCLKEEFQAGITQRLENLDQSVRDLLQFEFAWITIRETKIANKVGQNVMLLTYVSIFYLPLGFCAALWAIPNITDNTTRTPFILTATVVSLVTLLITFNMEKLATIKQSTWKKNARQTILRPPIGLALPL